MTRIRRIKFPLLIMSVFLFLFLLNSCSMPDINDTSPPRIHENDSPPISIPDIYYSEFGAKGDGISDDFDAIIAAHAEANLTGAKVYADADAIYYIGGAAKTIRIETDTDWTGAEFIIDDSAVNKSEENPNAWLGSWVFEVASAFPEIQITSVHTIMKDHKKLDLSLPYDAVLVSIDSGTTHYIRNGGTNPGTGSDQTDIFIIDKDGNIDPTTPIIWDFVNVTSLTAYPIDEKILTITGGKFTTIANLGGDADNYMNRNIRVSRSNVIIDGLVHFITGEEQGAPYYGFIRVENCTNVTVRNTTLTGHRGGGRRGSYDLYAIRSINLSVINCDQTNDITNNFWWGIFASNYSKNILFDNVKFSRFDAHRGVHNASILNSEIGHQGINAIGSGLLLIENTTVFASRNFITLRTDYGSTWEGKVTIRNSKFAPNQNQLLNNARIIQTNNNGRWDYGYKCYMPETITIEGLTVCDEFAPADYNGVVLINASDTSMRPYPYILTKSIYISRFISSKPFRISNIIMEQAEIIYF